MKRALGFAVTLALGACASSPAPISYGGSQGSAGVSPASADDAGETAALQADWAAGPGTPLSAYALQPDEAHPYDPRLLPRTHRVGENEQLYEIASRYQIPLRALIEENQLEPPYALSAGRELRLPPPRLHRVERGESFEDVARRYNVDPRSLGLLNRMSAPYRVRAGDTLVLPALARAEPLLGPPASSRQDAGGTAPSAPRFAWPLRGAIVARFGAQEGGRRLDGVEIAASDGARAGAAGDGEVVYAGADLPAYGALVLVRHEDGYVSAYGYGARALVREGQSVRAGEAVLEVGRIGAGPARLLFQIRQASRAVDPLPLLQ